MKKMMAVALMGLSTLAFTKEIKLYSTLDGYAETSAKFEINSELGRAWVNLEIDEGPTDVDFETYELRVKVDGLSFNNENGSVIYTDGNKTTNCMVTTSRGRGLFKRTLLASTGNCKFTKKKMIKKYDNGFEIKTRSYIETYLTIK